MPTQVASTGAASDAAPGQANGKRAAVPAMASQPAAAAPRPPSKDVAARLPAHTAEVFTSPHSAGFSARGGAAARRRPPADAVVETAPASLKRSQSSHVLLEAQREQLRHLLPEDRDAAHCVEALHASQPKVKSAAEQSEAAGSQSADAGHSAPFSARHSERAAAPETISAKGGSASTATEYAALSNGSAPTALKQSPARERTAPASVDVAAPATPAKASSSTQPPSPSPRPSERSGTGRASSVRSSFTARRISFSPSVRIANATVPSEVPASWKVPPGLGGQIALGGGWNPNPTPAPRNLVAEVRAKEAAERAARKEAEQREALAAGSQGRGGTGNRRRPKSAPGDGKRTSSSGSVRSRPFGRWGSGEKEAPPPLPTLASESFALDVSLREEGDAMLSAGLGYIPAENKELLLVDPDAVLDVHAPLHPNGPFGAPLDDNVDEPLEATDAQALPAPPRSFYPGTLILVRSRSPDKTSRRIGQLSNGGALAAMRSRVESGNPLIDEGRAAGTSENLSQSTGEANGERPQRVIADELDALVARSNVTGPPLPISSQTSRDGDYNLSAQSSVRTEDGVVLWSGPSHSQRQAKGEAKPSGWARVRQRISRFLSGGRSGAAPAPEPSQQDVHDAAADATLQPWRPARSKRPTSVRGHRSNDDLNADPDAVRIVSREGVPTLAPPILVRSGVGSRPSSTKEASTSIMHGDDELREDLHKRGTPWDLDMSAFEALRAKDKPSAAQPAASGQASSTTAAATLSQELPASATPP